MLAVAVSLDESGEGEKSGGGGGPHLVVRFRSKEGELLLARGVK